MARTMHTLERKEVFLYLNTSERENFKNYNFIISQIVKLVVNDPDWIPTKLPVKDCGLD